MATTVRLDAETEQLIRRLRRRRATTKSEVIREAIRQLASRELRVEKASRPYDAVKRLIGSVDSGGMYLSKGTGPQFAALLAERARGSVASRSSPSRPPAARSALVQGAADRAPLRRRATTDGETR